MTASRARLLANQGFLLAYAPLSFEQGDGLLRQAALIAETLGDPALRGQYLLGRSLNRLAWMQCRECAEAGLEAAELLRGSGNVWDEVEVLGFATYGLVGAGRFGEAARLATYGEPVAERLGSVPALLQFHRTHGMVGDAESGDV